MAARFEDFYDTCPKCGANMIGDPIPEKDRRLFGDTHFKRWIGVEDSRTDRLSSIQCAECGADFPPYLPA